MSQAYHGNGLQFFSTGGRRKLKSFFYSISTALLPDDGPGSKINLLTCLITCVPAALSEASSDFMSVCLPQNWKILIKNWRNLLLLLYILQVLMLFLIHFLLYCIFVSYNLFLFFFLHFILCRMCVCHMFNKVLTYLLTYWLINLCCGELITWLHFGEILTLIVDLRTVFIHVCWGKKIESHWLDFGSRYTWWCKLLLLLLLLHDLYSAN